MQLRLSSAIIAALLPLAAAQGQDKPASAPTTTQQLFDTATQAAAANDDAGALAALDQLETRVAKNARSLAVVRVRKGMALVALQRWDEAQSYLEKGLSAMPADDASLLEDRMAAADKLGGMALTDLDYPAALRYYGLVLKDGKLPLFRLRAYLGSARARIFGDPAGALEDIAQAEQIGRTDLALPRDQMAQIAQIKGRALLNQGRFAEAETVLGQAVKGQGGLSLKVDYNDLVARSDASIAALLAGHEQKARDYLVYTGAGRMPDQDFTTGADMPLPPCGIDGVQPEDKAVVEFGIGDDGEVVYAQPVYGSRIGPLAPIFAKAVRNWTWRAEDVKKIPQLFRMSMRLELRCSTEGGGPPIGQVAIAALDEWLSGIGPMQPADREPGANRAALIARFDQLQAGSADAPGLMALALAILRTPTVTRDDVSRLAPLVVAQADRRAPPPLARLGIDAVLREAEAKTERGKNRRYALQEARYQADPTAHAVFRLLRYDGLKSGEKARNAALLDQVISDPAIERDSPLRAAAFVRRANLRAAAKDMAGAQADFVATGLDAAQCSIVDAQPAVQSAPLSSADYPSDMLSVGIEGWTRVQFDVSADGSTVNQRAVIAYPPMAFGRNAEKIIARARYEQSFRPAGHLGCGGNQQGFVFRR